MQEFRRFALVVLGLCFVANGAGRGIADTYTVVLLPLSHEFGWKRGQLTGVYSIYLLVQGGLSPLIGGLFDRYGPRVVYPAGYLAMACGFWFAASLDSIWAFYLFVGVTSGMGVSATGMVPAASIVSRWFRDRLSLAIGLVYSGIGFGMITIVPVAQYLVVHLGWRGFYRIMAIALGVVAVFAVALPWGRIMAGSVPARAPASRTAGDASHGTTVREALRSPLFWSLAQVYVFTSTGMFGVFVQVVAYLREAGFDPMTAANAYGFAGMLSTPAMILMAGLADRFGARWVVTTTFGMTLSGILALIAVGRAPSHALLAAFVVLFGCSMGARGPIISAIANRVFVGPRRATIYGMLFGANLIGAAFGSWFGGVLFDATGGNVAGFVVSMGCLAIAALPFLFYPALRRFA